MRCFSWKYGIAMAACLAGCGERPQAVGVPQVPFPDPVEASAISGLPKTPPTATIRFDPAALEDCRPPQVGTIHWDASKSSADTIDVKIVKGDGSENLFATNGTVGSQVTQAWMRPGLLVIVRDHSTGAELGRKIVDSKPCSR